MKIILVLVALIGFVASNADEMQVWPQNVKIPSGHSLVFSPTLTDSSGTTFSPPKVVWESEGGEITKTGRFKAGNTPGEFFVTAKYKDKAAKVKIIVVDKNKKTETKQLDIFPKDISIKPGRRIFFSAVISDASGICFSSPKIKWKTEAGEISKSGKLKVGNTPGEYSVIAVYQEKMAKIKITVTDTSKKQELTAGLKPIPCSTCNATGIMTCPCNGKGTLPCPGPCIKEGVGNWETIPPHGYMRVWRYTDRQGNKKWQGAKPSHIGEVMYVKNGEFINEGKCKVCQGKAVVPCKLCDSKGKVTCTSCKGSKTIIPDVSSSIILKDGSVILGEVVGEAKDTVMVKTADGKYRKLKRSEIQSLPKK